MQTYVCMAWGKKSVADQNGVIIEGKLWATVVYHADSGKLYETRDGKRWRNGYGDEITYRDRRNAALTDYLDRLEYYRTRGYLIRAAILKGDYSV